MFNQIEIKYESLKKLWARLTNQSELLGWVLFSILRLCIPAQLAQNVHSKKKKKKKEKKFTSKF